MPRQLDKLPRWGYSYFLDTPRRDNDQPKQGDTAWHDLYWKEMPRRQGRLPLKGEPPVPRYSVSLLAVPRRTDIIKYQVSCTICLDQGCDKCPEVKMEEENE